MGEERSTEEIFDTLFTQAVCLWGEEHAERLRTALRPIAEGIAVMARHHLPPDIEPRFFA